MNRRLTVIAALLAGCGAPTAQSPEAPPPTPPPEAPPVEPAPPEGTPAATAESEAPEAEEAPPPDAPPTPDPFADAGPPGSPTQKLMRDHFRETADIRAAVISGDLSKVATAAHALQEMEGIEGLKKGWRPSATAVQSASKRIDQSSDVPEVAAAVADIGVACGRCHAGGGPSAKVEDPPEAGQTIASRMKRHVWATERLWEGLYVPSDKAWDAGAAALKGEPFPKEVLKKGGVHGRSAANTFMGLIAKAADKKKPEERAELYASLLETCSSCHMATRGKK